MSYACRSCVDDAVLLVKLLKDAELHARVGEIKESNDKIREVQELAGYMVERRCLSIGSSIILSEHLSEAFKENEAIAKSLKLRGIANLDLTWDVANFCKKAFESEARRICTLPKERKEVPPA